MKIKKFILNNKSIFICLIIALGLGFITGKGYVPKAEYNTTVEKKNQLDSQIVGIDKELETAKSQVRELQANKDEMDKLAKEEAEKKAEEEAAKLAKEEADKLAQEEAAKLAQEEADKLAQEEAARLAQQQQNTNNYVASENGQTNGAAEASVGEMVWLSASGDKYHSKNNCGNMNPQKARQISLQDALAKNYKPCTKCY